MQTVSIKLFEDAFAFTMKMKRFSNRRQGNLSGVDVGADKSRFKLTKKLIECPELDAIVEYQTELYNWATKRSVPSFFREGVYLVKKSMAEEFNAKLEAGAIRLQTELVPALLRAYPEAIEAAREALNGQFSILDYPGQFEMAARFGIEWNWITVGVPDDLPLELRKAEAEKITAQFKDAETQIMSALREGFAEIVSHVTDRLTPGESGKDKTFRNTLFENLTEFIETFNARNLVNDSQLAEMVTKANEILAQVKGLAGEKAEAVRDNAMLRERMAQQFAELKGKVEVMEKPGRKFDFSE